MAGPIASQATGVSDIVTLSKNEQKLFIVMHAKQILTVLTQTKFGISDTTCPIPHGFLACLGLTGVRRSCLNTHTAITSFT